MIAFLPTDTKWQSRYFWSLRRVLSSQKVSRETLRIAWESLCPLSLSLWFQPPSFQVSLLSFPLGFLKCVSFRPKNVAEKPLFSNNLLGQPWPNSAPLFFIIFLVINLATLNFCVFIFRFGSFIVCVQGLCVTGSFQVQLRILFLLSFIEVLMYELWCIKRSIWQVDNRVF